MEAHQPVRLNRQDGGDEADMRKQLAWMPLDLGDHPALLIPGRRLIVEILEEPLDLGLRRPPHRPVQPMRDFLAQDIVGRRPDGIEMACFFQPRLDRRDRIGSIRPEEAQDARRCIPRKHWIKDSPPAVSAVDVAVS